MIEAILGRWFFIRKRRPGLEDWTGPWKVLQNAMLVSKHSWGLSKDLNNRRGN